MASLTWMTKHNKIFHNQIVASRKNLEESTLLVAQTSPLGGALALN